MKKFLTMLCMLTCVLGLTACGEYEPTEMEQQKGDEAVSMATNFILPYTKGYRPPDRQSLPPRCLSAPVL